MARSNLKNTLSAFKIWLLIGAIGLPTVAVAGKFFGDVIASKLNVGNVQLLGNTVSTTNTNGNLLLSPNGSGVVQTGNMSVTGNIVVSGLTDSRDVSVDGTTLDALNTKFSPITTNQVTNISNQGATTISGTQWGYLGGLDQALSTSSSPNFAGLTIAGSALLSATGVATLTNKTIDASSNTLTNISNTSIATNAGILRNKLASGTANHVVINDGTGVLSSEAQLAISRGGTGQTTKTLGFNALAPLTAKGDLIAFDGTNGIRLPVAADGLFLKTDSSQSSGLIWAVSSGSSADLTTATGVLAISKGGTGQTTSPAAFNALSPITTLGDTIYGSAPNTASRLAGNTTATKMFLSQTGTGTVSAQPSWLQPGFSDLSGSVALATQSSGTLPIANGGTGQTSATLAFDALSPMTTKGDLTSRSTTGNARVPIGSDGMVLVADSAQTTGLKWATNPSAPERSDNATNLSLATSVAGNALTISVKDKSGADPSAGSAVTLGFRNATSATGTFNTRTVTAALSIAVPSTATMGWISGVTDYLYVYAIDNAGTVELALSTSLVLDQGSVYTTTVMNSSATSRAILYSTVARTNVPVRLIGRVKGSEVTAGTWATNMTEISLAPFTTNPVVTNSLTVERMERVRTNFCTADPCTILAQSGSWVSSVNRLGVGLYRLNIPTGIFSAAPQCVFTLEVGSANTSSFTCFADVNTAWSSTAVYTQCRATSTNVAVEAQLQVICMGPR